MAGIMYNGQLVDTRGKSADQIKALKFFNEEGGCLGKNTSCEEYDALLAKKIEEINSRKKAIDKIGLDEEELKEIPPVHFCGYDFGSTYTAVGKDGRVRASKFEETWLFFSDTQVYMYNVKFDLTSQDKKERTEEYFYKDITNFSTSSDTVEVLDLSVSKKGCGGTKETAKRRTVESSQFALIVPGDKFACSTYGSKADEVETAVRGMKAKLREKKQ